VPKEAFLQISMLQALHHVKRLQHLMTLVKMFQMPWLQRQMVELMGLPCLNAPAALSLSLHHHAQS